MRTPVTLVTSHPRSEVLSTVHALVGPAIGTVFEFTAYVHRVVAVARQYNPREYDPTTAHTRALRAITAFTALQVAMGELAVATLDPERQAIVASFASHDADEQSAAKAFAARIQATSKLLSPLGWRLSDVCVYLAEDMASIRAGLQAQYTAIKTTLAALDQAEGATLKKAKVPA